MKIVFTIFLILISPLSFCTLISLTNVSGNAGSNVTMPLELYTGNERVAGIQVDILFSSPISYVSSSRGSAADAAGKDVSASPIEGGIRLLIYGLNQNIMDDGIVANIVFSISSGASNGEYPVILTNAVGTDENGTTFAISTENGSIIVGGGGGGDCTGSAIFIPASAHSEGANQTKWRTDLSIFNPNNSEASISMKFLISGNDNTNSQCISAGNVSSNSTKGFNDIVLSLFNKNPGVGGIAIYSTVSGVNIMSRTYNETQSGTYGQGIQGRTSSYGISSGKKGILVQLHQNPSYRTNIGFLNITNSQAQVEVDLYDENGNRLGTLNYTLKPYEQFQENQIFTKVTSSNVSNGRAEVIVNSGTILAYASVVDNFSGDPTYIEPFIK